MEYSNNPVACAVASETPVSGALEAVHQNAITVTEEARTVTMKVPLSAFERSWQFLEDLGMRDYYIRIAQERGFSEGELRSLLATFWHTSNLGFIESSGYELCLSMAYYGGPEEEHVQEALAHASTLKPRERRKAA